MQRVVYTTIRPTILPTNHDCMALDLRHFLDLLRIENSHHALTTRYKFWITMSPASFERNSINYTESHDYTRSRRMPGITRAPTQES
jgi:hypothetical protein